MSCAMFYPCTLGIKGDGNKSSFITEWRLTLKDHMRKLSHKKGVKTKLILFFCCVFLGLSDLGKYTDVFN